MQPHLFTQGFLSYRGTLFWGPFWGFPIEGVIPTSLMDRASYVLLRFHQEKYHSPMKTSSFISLKASMCDVSVNQGNKEYHSKSSNHPNNWPLNHNETANPGDDWKTSRQWPSIRRCYDPCCAVLPAFSCTQPRHRCFGHDPRFPRISVTFPLSAAIAFSHTGPWDDVVLWFSCR